MGVETPDFAAGVAGGKGQRPWPLSVYIVGFVAVFVLAAGAGLGVLAGAGQLSDGLLILTLAGLVVFAASALVFYRRIARPVADLSAVVQAAMANLPPGPIVMTGSAEVSSLVHNINHMIAKTRAEVESAARLAAIVESSSDAIIGKTLDGTITDWNSGAEEQYGYAPGEIIGRSIAQLTTPDRRAELAPILQRVRRGERIEQFETKRRCKDGTIIDVSVSVSPIRDAGGAVTGAASVARNITERARLEAGRRALERHLQQIQRVESLGQLAAGVAHDFNNLLAIIMNYAGFVAQETAGNPAVQADIEQIQEAAQRAARIARQLLIVGRRDTAQPAALALNTVVTDTRSLLSSTIGAGVEIMVALAADPLTIKADHGQVEQVLLNLTVNARDAMPHGGTLTITTGLAELDEDSGRRLSPPVGPGRYVELAVSDTGTGMSAETAARIFEPFFTTKPLGQGTGLGLATVYAAVTAAGGGISVDTEEGGGTTFRVLYPAVAAQAPAMPDAEAPRARGTGQTILVVDDEPPVLKLTSRILRQNGYATLEAGTFEEALSLASAQDLQLLLTDSVMPRMSGPTLAERIGRLRPGLAVLYMSGYSEEALRPQRAPGDAAEYIQKPFTSQALLEKVHAVLDPPLSA
jgi:PAS domain S-box-containing protein